MSRCTLSLLCFAFIHLTLTGIIRAEVAETVNGVQVELIEPGTEPRHKIRFAPQQGDKQSSVMIMKILQTMTIGGNKAPGQNIPPQKIAMEIEVKDVSSDGDITYAYKYTDFDVMDDPNQPSPLTPTLRATLKPMIGTTGSGIVTNRGFTKKGEINIPDGVAAPLKQMLDGMKDSMNRMSSPVPAEPVGRGAKWRVVQDVSANGMTLKQTSVHEITRIDQDGFEFNVTVSQQAEPQEIKNPALPPGTTLKLDSLQSDGSGTSTFTMSSVLPVKSQLKLSTVVNMDITAAGQNQKLTTEMSTDISMSDGVE